MVFHQNRLFEVNIFVYGEGDEAFAGIRRNLGEFLGKDTAYAPLMVKDFLVKGASNNLNVTYLKMLVLTEFISFDELKRLRAQLQK